MILFATTAAPLTGWNWDLLTRAGGVVAIISAVLTGGFALFQWKKDLRWKQAELARSMLDEIFDYPPSDDAWRMVDGEMDYKDSNGASYTITMADVRAALPQKPSGSWGESPGTHVYIRWCFDALLYYLERLELSLEIEIIEFRDIRASVLYYVSLMAKSDKELYLTYARTIGFDGAVAFLDRFSEWRDPSDGSP